MFCRTLLHHTHRHISRRYSTFQNMKLLFGNQIHSISPLETIKDCKNEFAQRIGMTNTDKIIFFPLKKVDKALENLTPEEISQNKYFNLGDELFEISFDKQLENDQKMSDNLFVMAALKTNFQILYSPFFASKDLHDVPVTAIPFQAGEITFIVQNLTNIKQFALRKIQLGEVVIFKTQLENNPIVSNTNQSPEYTFEKEIIQNIDEGKVFDVYGVMPKQSALKTVANATLSFLVVLWIYLYIL